MMVSKNLINITSIHYYSTINKSESVEFELELPEKRIARMASLLCSLVPPIVIHCPHLRLF
jgi:hypothetical protein